MAIDANLVDAPTRGCGAVWVKRRSEAWWPAIESRCFLLRDEAGDFALIDPERANLRDHDLATMHYSASDEVREESVAPGEFIRVMGTPSLESSGSVKAPYRDARPELLAFDSRTTPLSMANLLTAAARSREPTSERLSPMIKASQVGTCVFMALMGVMIAAVALVWGH